ncbi:ZN852 protein, partial [Halcyon senegalensis]|nr:ZN852 protein [Halcyon senegalensis]
TGQRPYRCAGCGKSFRWRSKLIAHWRGQTGDKPFACAHCAETFRHVSHFFQHRHVHTTESLD